MELLVVIALLSVLAGLIVPRIGRSASQDALREAAARFRHTARTVRELAVGAQRLCAIELDLDRGVYGIVRPAGGERAAGWQPVQLSWLKAQHWPPAITRVSYRASDGTTATTGTQYVQFYPDGTCSGAALRLAARDGAYSVIVSPHTGAAVCGAGATLTDSDLDRYDLGD